MHIQITSARRGEEGYALLTVIAFTAVSLIILGGALMWTSTSSQLNQRNNRYYQTVAAAEAATEQAIASISTDFKNSGEPAVANNMSNYKAKVPKAAQHPAWGRFTFNDGKGHKDAISVSKIANQTYTNLQSQYAGLSGYASTYRILANAADLLTPGKDVIGAVQQDIQIATVPIFQYAIFYSVDLEMNPGQNMTVKGRVHSNGNIYTQPNSATLTFATDVTSSGKIIADKKPGDPSTRSPGSVDYQGEHDGGTVSEVLPVGTNNSPEAVHGILEMPPVNESPNSPMGQQRYFNKADLTIVRDNSSTGWTIRDAPKNGNGNGKNLKFPDVSSFVSTNHSFYDAREGKTMDTIEIDVGKLNSWNAANNSQGDVQIVYVADARTTIPANTEPAVRIVNGQQLPPSGLTVATPDPLYVKGNYNVTTNGTTFSTGTTNTANTLPASLVADAITILSTNWVDSNSTGPLSGRNATDTTVNAAFLGGIVGTTNGTYSGGVENFPRFLENWTGKKMTYNGSMVVMFFSTIANHAWQTTGVYYNAPTRNWSFDFNFLDPMKQPPGTPAVRLLIRGKWSIIPPNT